MQFRTLCFFYKGTENGEQGTNSFPIRKLIAIDTIRFIIYDKNSLPCRMKFNNKHLIRNNIVFCPINFLSINNQNCHLLTINN